MTGSAATPCHAPFTSMYLDPTGEVRACCQNVWQRLGNVTEARLLDMWHGEPMATLRAALTVGDHSRGCERCAVYVDDGHPEAAYARSYDWLGPTVANPAWPQQLELALSNACNLQCVMCNGELSSAIRIHRERRAPLPTVYGEAFFEELDQFLPHLRSVAILGGEPFLGKESLRVMHRLVELGLRPLCSFTTNGTQWSDRIERIVSSLPSHVVVSIDGYSPATFEATRIGAEHAVVIENLERFRAAVAMSAGSVSVSFCMMRTTWQELGDYLLWADDRDLDVYVNDVAYPPDLSLLHAGTTELHEVLSTMEAADLGLRGRLGRNRPVWDRELDTVRRLLRESSHRSTRAPSREPHRESIVSVPAPAVRPAPGTATSKPTLRARVDADEAALITEVDAGATSTIGLDLGSLVGESIWAVQRHLCRALGDTVSSHLRRHDDGSEEFDVLFERNGQRTAMSAWLSEPDRGGQVWLFEFSTS